MKRLLFVLCHLSFTLCALNLYAATEILDTEIETAIQAASSPVFDAANIHPTIRLVADNKFNAFTSGGEDIFINTGLITKIDNWGELQAVLAHEIGHLQLGHMAQMTSRMRAEATRTLALQMLGIGLLAVNPQIAVGAMAGTSGIAAQSMLAFGRDEERAADDYAIKLLTKIHGDPNALLSVFSKMQGAKEDKINPSNINHPLTEERIKNIKLRIGEVRSTEKTDKNLKVIQAKLIGYLDSRSRVDSLYPENNKTDEALYARAISRTKSQDYETARKGIKTLISKKPKNPYFLELLGDIEFALGNYDSSVTSYEKSLKLLSNNAPQIEIALALVLSERNKDNDFVRATELCKKSILSRKLPLAYWVLAKTDSQKSDYYLAEYYYLSKDSVSAKRHAAQAVKKLPEDSPEYFKAKDITEIK